VFKYLTFNIILSGLMSTNATDKLRAEVTDTFTILVPKKHKKFDLEVLKAIPDKYSSNREWCYEELIPSVKKGYNNIGKGDLGYFNSVLISALTDLQSDGLIEKDSPKLLYRRTNLGRKLLKEVENLKTIDGSTVVNLGPFH